MTVAPARGQGIALAALCLSALMFGLEISSVPVILSTIGEVLHGDFTDLQWTMNAYTIACTTVLMASGALADRFGRKRLLAIAVATFGATSLLCGLAQDVTVLIVGRALQGMSGGTMLICQVAILSHQFPAGRERTRAFGAWGIVFGTGLGFGPVIGGGLVALSNWRWVFLVHAVVAAVTLILIFRGVRESRDPTGNRLDIGGIVTLSLAVFGLVFFITQGPGLGLNSVATLGSLVLAMAFGAAFVVVERSGSHPMIDFSVFRIRAFSGALLGSAGMNFSYWPLMIYLPIYLQRGLGYGTAATSLCLLAYTIPTLVLPPVAERLAVRYRPGVIIPAGLYLIGLGFVLLHLGSGVADAGWVTVLPGSLLAGTGLGLANTPVTNTTTGSVPADRSGMASGIDMSARMISLAVNIALMGLILTLGISASLSEHLQLSGPQVQALAEHVANGDDLAALMLAFPALPDLDSTGTLVRSALTHGFGLITLYGGIAVSALATTSLIIFRVRQRTRVKGRRNGG
ncbi:MFS transporter [Actinokineospora diospyrosa]|uniref:Drug resistance transporter, EmrB/QacA subfamily n=1 Tax=Actinokineospora diospyrosa TaxID=103728 RepID=A0ABT1IGH0_9PSEU|nr:MFS transporter [Actinokineospora diospyrosa]MCP2271737.1 drug resistance transporter, EmrB/QacA subfamily [Actinokineospora diospyrosa]